MIEKDFLFVNATKTYQIKARNCEMIFQKNFQLVI